MAITATKLRADIYRILDEVLESGTPVEIERGGRRLRIVPVEDVRPSRLDSLTPRPDFIIGDPEAIVHLDWYEEWKP